MNLTRHFLHRSRISRWAISAGFRVARRIFTNSKENQTMDDTYKGLGADGPSDFKGLYNHDSVSNPEPNPSPTDIANNPGDKKNKPRGTVEAPCPDDNKPANADSFAHR
jgi:hypothetical protein